MYGEIVKTMRGNLTQKQLAEITGISQAAIAGYEKNKREPSREILEKIAEATGYKLKIIVEKEIRKNTEQIESVFFRTRFNEGERRKGERRASNIVLTEELN